MSASRVELSERFAAASERIATGARTSR